MREAEVRAGLQEAIDWDERQKGDSHIEESFKAIKHRPMYGKEIDWTDWFSVLDHLLGSKDPIFVGDKYSYEMPMKAAKDLEKRGAAKLKDTGNGTQVVATTAAKRMYNREGNFRYGM